jgi:hypothetical protein
MYVLVALLGGLTLRVVGAIRSRICEVTVDGAGARLPRTCIIAGNQNDFASSAKLRGKAARYLSSKNPDSKV